MSRISLLAAAAVSVLAACGGGADEPPPGLPDGVVAVPLTSIQALAYAAPLAVGGQTFAVQVDTGSTTTAVAAAACGSACEGVTPLYATGATAVDKKRTADAEYGDGSTWSGEIFEDQAGFGSATNVALDFVAITKQDQFFLGNDTQGILGLGPADLLDTGTTAYFDTVAAAGMDHQLGFQMCPDRGQMWLGGFDGSAAASEPVPTPMVAMDPEREPFYAIQIAGLGLGSDPASLGEGTAAFGDTLVDTGTSVSFVPTPVATALIAQVNASAGFQQLFPGQMLANTEDGGCVASSTVTTDQLDAALPTMSIRFPRADGSAPVPVALVASRSYMYVEGDGHFCLAVVDSGEATPDGGSLIGDVLLQSFVTVFDADARTIAFAPQQGCATAVAQGVPQPALAHAVPAPRGPWWQTNPRAHGPRPRRRLR